MILRTLHHACETSWFVVKPVGYLTESFAIMSCTVNRWPLILNSISLLMVLLIKTLNILSHRQTLNEISYQELAANKVQGKS